MTLHGLICKTCHNSTVDSEHKKLHDMKKGEWMVWDKHDKFVQIKQSREDGYVARAEDENSDAYIPHEDIDQFRLPFIEEEKPRPSTDGY